MRSCSSTRREIALPKLILGEHTSIHELENVQLTGNEKNKLFHLTNRLIEIGLEFAVPAHTMEEHADMKRPA